jgi:hypothetical protein
MNEAFELGSEVYGPGTEYGYPSERQCYSTYRKQNLRQNPLKDGWNETTGEWKYLEPTKGLRA